MSLLLLWNCGKANFMRKPHRPVLVQTPVETEGDGLASRTLADPEKLDRPLKHFENADFSFIFFFAFRHLVPTANGSACQKTW